LAKVVLGSPLQSLTDDRKELKVQGSTIGEVFGELIRSYPELKKKLLTPGGTPSYSVLVYLDGLNIRNAELEKTAVSESSIIRIFPVVGAG